MNEELFERLVVAIEKQSTAFPWDSLISALALIASWITIFLLLKNVLKRIDRICKCPLNLYEVP